MQSRVATGSIIVPMMAHEKHASDLRRQGVATGSIIVPMMARI